jgi:glycerol-3-phosphate dehydrogenase (NAD(P)+)
MNGQSTAIAIVGSGSWGTALATMWSGSATEVLLWGRNPALIDQLQRTRQNAEYLPGIQLPANVRPTSDLSDCAGASLVVVVTPSTALRTIARQLHEVLPNDTVLLSCTKGIEHGTGMRMSEVLAEELPGRAVAVLSGPNLAYEIARSSPAATVLGCADQTCAIALQSRLGNARFRIYTSDDIVSVELGGALKNVFAIAAGVCDGLGLGDNAKAALITRSLAELIRLGRAMGGNPHTFYGLSGAGDLILTCFSDRSRNHQVGRRIGRGESLSEIRGSMRMVAEGIPTARSAYDCARKLNVDAPIINEVYQTLYHNKPPSQAVEELLQRDPKPERTTSLR